ncbi:phosphate transporter PHO1-3-like [Phragmites australis]|uniref:phosphate transporter PHO1-3-like n=1 Tax=Phragmites australis TaxID=29695 RepID=UPI002D78F455|nr:phosphate transporter PHO1-3-like [Phragmites australis]
MNTTAHSHAHISTPHPMTSLETLTTHHSRALHCYSLRSPGPEEAGEPIMVKFSKQFEGQLVPEWKEAFVDYWQLKKDIKKLQAVAAAAVASPSLCQTPTAAHWVMRLPFLHPHGHHKEPDAIQVHRKLAIDGSGDGAVAGEVYGTEVVDGGFADTEAAGAFFERLDQQLNKVNRFYERKEGEFLERGESLRRQLQILVELKAAVTEQQRARQCGGSSAGSADAEDTSVSCSILHGEKSLRGIAEQEQEGDEKLTKDVFTKSTDEGGEGQLAISQNLGGSGRLAKPREEPASKLRTLSGRVVTCQGRSVRINIPVTTPSRTVTAIRELLFEDMLSQSKRIDTQGGDGNEKLSINKKKVHQAEKMIRGALVELYKGLAYLRTYRSLNMMAFVKIMKKFDKVTAKEVQPIYLKVVESSYFNSSDKAIRLMDDVEELFVSHFTEGDKRKAMKYLKPNQKEESHATTFFIGLCTGGFVALFIGYCIMAHIAGMYTQQSNKVYMSTSYPVLSMFSLFFLHLFLYGCNIFMWRKTRINYTFIFEFAPTKELKYRDVFLICATSMTIVVGVMFAHLTLIVKGYSSCAVQAIPGALLLVFLLILVCPFNIIYRSSRYHFLRVIRNIILTPFYKVVMVDFFMADQLCSQVPMLRSLEYLACYYISSSYRTQDYGYCTRVKHFRDLAYAVSFLPYYWRAMQCARRWFDEGDINHIVNLGKYVSAMLAAGTKVAYENNNSAGWLSLVVIVSSIATMYQLYWDLVKDWGLLQFNSKNTWLRNDLILKQKYIYFLSMGLNLVLRLAWLQTVIHPNIGSLDSRVTLFFLAALEVIRRGHWNFYRLENEHLNNAGKFRAVKLVPLPFHEVEED